MPCPALLNRSSARLTAWELHQVCTKCTDHSKEKSSKQSACLRAGFRGDHSNVSAPVRPREWNFTPPYDCPCTPQLLCDAAPDLFGDQNDSTTEPCQGSIPFPSSKGYSIHGGAGRESLLTDNGAWTGRNEWYRLHPQADLIGNLYLLFRS